MSETGAPAVSLVVIAYDMARELPRTLVSLSRPYQRRPPDGGWEIIVIDTGSPEPLDPSAWDGLDAAVVFHRRAPADHGSPVAAINFGLSIARGAFIGVLIDGARLASPGLLGACARAAALHPRAIVAPRNHHLGPSLQHDAGMAGWTREAEDRLLASIDWPAGADRLPEIATPELADPAAPMLESNAIFMARALWDELGGFDPAFHGRGGGAANLDLFIRACALPGAQLIRLVDEGTFHQTHGGTTTGAGARGAAELLKRGSRQYFRLRKRPMRAVRDPGWLYRATTDEVVRPS